MNKKISIIFSVFFLAFLLMPSLAAAADTTFSTDPATECPTCPPGEVCFDNPISACSVSHFVSNLLGNLQGIIALIAIVVLVIGGIWYMVSFGNEESLKKAKMIITGAVVGLALTLAAPSFIREILDILNNGNVSPSDVTDATQAITIQNILLNILNFLLAIVGIIAIIAMILGGSMYLMSYGDEEQVKKGKQIITYAIIGIAVSLGALIIVKQIETFFL